METAPTDELAKILWNYNKLNQEIEKADVIIILGSHDTRVAKRGVELFFQQYAPLILFSGGFGRLTDGSWKQPEAQVFSQIALEAGIPKEKILIEDQSTNTEENLRFSMDLLNRQGVSVKKVILVHKPYMERRQYATWLRLFPDVEATITSPQESFEEYIAGDSIPEEESISVIVGDTQRIKLYPDKGFMVAQEIPTEVWMAYEELVARGYTSHLVKE